MNLKEIQIYGFKSFSDKLSLKFDYPITGVVGPNGCGKSNVVDAIRWVLGEQSAKALRGKTMLDLIFSGTEQRKSMSYCEVTLILDNKPRIFPIDLDEITISRKLYRSNESEYYLNKNLTRLKDISDLLREAGLGREGYSIVGQGRMDAILNARPEDRRAIFEEALGISKFRVRKAETEKKLEKTRDNIVRLYDIINELNRQLTPLKKQANDTQKYLALVEELKYHEINSYIYNYDNSSANKNAIKQKIVAIDEQLAISQDKYKQAFALYEKLFAEITDIDAVITDLRRTQLNLSVLIERYSGELKLLNERIKHNGENNKKLNVEIDDLKTLISNTEHNIELTKKSTIEMKEQEGLITAHLETLKQEHFSYLDAITIAQEKLDKKRKELMVIIDRLSVQRSKTSVVKGELNSLLSRISRIDNDCDEITNRLNQMSQSQSKEIKDLIDSNFAYQTTQEMAGQIDGYVLNVSTALSKMTLDQGLTQYINSLVENISLKCKTELKADNVKAENWQQNLILMSVLAERLAKFSALQEAKIENRNKLLKEKQEISGKCDFLKLSLQDSLSQEEIIQQEKDTSAESANQIQKEFTIVKDKKDRIQEEINNNKLKLAGITSNIRSYESRISSYNQTLSRSNIDINQKKRQIAMNEIQIKDLYNQINSSGGNAEEVAELNGITQKLESADKLKKDIQSKFSEADHDRQFYLAEVQQHTESKNKEEFNLVRLDDDMKLAQQRMEDEYDLTYSSAMRYKDINYNFEASKPQIGKLRNSISRLGYINQNAIEDYNSTQKRYDEINTQIEDLKKAEADLTKFLKDITREITVRFNDGFEIINANFGMVFKELFAGGHAHMTIDRQENKEEMDYGIEIEAQPPGKKLQNITLLSGGERTLTAVAILFAILKLRPMPFCVLDEIEAALDDANAQRISSYIKKFVEDTQFIIITHKKPTMESCDVLYGVTMEEKGVSKIVSVQLTDALSTIAN
ncbi:MAG: AAA family ATPase [Clostridia bacterium]